MATRAVTQARAPRDAAPALPEQARVDFTQAPELCTQFWQACGSEPALACYVRQLPADLQTDVERVSALYERIVRRAVSLSDSFPAPFNVDFDARLNVARLSIFSKTTDIHTFFTAVCAESRAAETLRKSLNPFKTQLELANEITDWMGKNPTELEQIQKLDLSDCQLTHIPSRIGLFTNLISLKLHRNNLTTLPAEIGNCTALESLILTENLLTELPAQIARCANLRVIDIAHNQFTIFPPHLRGCRALEGISVNGNQLAVLPDWISEYASLQSLTAGANQLTVVPRVYGLPLRTLLLPHNQITELPAELGQCSELGILDVSHNQIAANRAVIARLFSHPLQELLIEGNPGTLQIEDPVDLEPQNPEAEQPRTCWQLILDSICSAVSWVSEQLMHLIQQIAQLCRR